MPVEVKWDDEDEITIIQIYSGHIVLEDYYHAIDEFCRLAQSVPHTVHSIMDRRAILSSKGSYLQAMKYGNDRLPDNVGMRILLKPSLMTKILVDMGKRLSPRLISQVHVVNTLEEARELVRAQKDTASASGEV